MASKRNALSFLIDHGVDPDLLIGFHFLPTYEEGVRFVNIKNAGGKFLPIFKVDDHLFRRPPEQLEECYCFTKLEPHGKNKANRTLGDGSRGYYWKNMNKEIVRDDGNNVIGCVTKLVLRRDKNTPTEWHILEYRDRKTPDAGRWVLCQIYKREKNNDAGSPIFFDPCIDHATLLHVESDVEAGQISSSISQVSSMWAIGARGDMNQGQHYEMGQCSYTEPDWVSNAATYPDLTGGHMNQDQIHGVDQSWYTPQDGVFYNSQQFLSSQNSGDDFGMGLLGQCSNTQPDWVFNAATDPDLTGGHMNQDQIFGVDQSLCTSQDGMVYNSQQFLSSQNSGDDFDMGLLDDGTINQDWPEF